MQPSKASWLERIARFAFDAVASAVLEQEEVDLGALMGGPIVGFIRAQGLEDFFDGIAFPRGPDLGMKLQVSTVRDTGKRMPRPLSRTNTLGALTCRLPRFSNHGGNCRSMKTPVNKSR